MDTKNLFTETEFNKNFKWIMEIGIDSKEEYEKTKREYLTRTQIT